MDLSPHFLAPPKRLREGEGGLGVKKLRITARFTRCDPVVGA